MWGQDNNGEQHRVSSCQVQYITQFSTLVNLIFRLQRKFAF